jgi:hypothetical protein
MYFAGGIYHTLCRATTKHRATPADLREPTGVMRRMS